MILLILVGTGTPPTAGSITKQRTRICLEPPALRQTIRENSDGQAWGGGLYDSDFALDLKATIKGVLRALLGED